MGHGSNMGSEKEGYGLFLDGAALCWLSQGIPKRLKRARNFDHARALLSSKPVGPFDLIPRPCESQSSLVQSAGLPKK